MPPASSLNRLAFLSFAKKDDKLARHLETSTVFSGLSNKIQNDLIEAVGDVTRIDKKEISAIPFVAVEVDETTDNKPSSDFRHIALCGKNRSRL